MLNTNSNRLPMATLMFPWLVCLSNSTLFLSQTYCPRVLFPHHLPQPTILRTEYSTDNQKLINMMDTDRGIFTMASRTVNGLAMQDVVRGCIQGIGKGGLTRASRVLIPALENIVTDTENIKSENAASFWQSNEQLN